jgi:hypothetical protein
LASLNKKNPENMQTIISKTFNLQKIGTMKIEVGDTSSECISPLNVGMEPDLKPSIFGVKR